jgi:integrase/recombinase XerD
MSGGPYGRGKAPERTCMKRALWPQHDQDLWISALNPADPFIGTGGTRAAHRAISNRNIERGYGRWLTFLSRQGLLSNTASPADRITPEAVSAYLKELDALGNKKNSVLVRLEELTEMAKVMGPERDWHSLKRMSARVRARAEPASAEACRLVGTDQLVALGFALTKKAARQASPLRSAILFRDGLIIAFLAHRPLRLRNLAGLTLGEDLVRVGESWNIVLPPTATKTHVILEYDWPEPLNVALETYLAVHRPLLVSRKGRWRAPIKDRLWVSSDGSPFTGMGLYQQITRRTRMAFGRSINPHLARDMAATTMAIHDPAHVLLAAPLLGHRTFSTTEQSYIQAQTLDAHRLYAGKLIELRDRLISDDEQDK